MFPPSHDFINLKVPCLHGPRKIPNSGAMRRTHAGFSLTEILVVIALVAILGMLSTWGITKVRQNAYGSTASSFLRQNAVAIQGFLDDRGRYPEAWDFRGGSGGGAWSWQLRDYLGFQNLDSWPPASLLHPRHGVKGLDKVSGWDRENLHHFCASTVLFQDVNDTKTHVRPTNLDDPTSTIMLGDGPLKRPNDPSSGAHAAWWSLRDGAVSGTPNNPVDQGTLRNSVEFWINGKAHFLFADGHVELLSPDQVRRKHFQLKRP